jgi:hypothetical protein
MNQTQFIENVIIEFLSILKPLKITGRKLIKDFNIISKIDKDVSVVILIEYMIKSMIRNNLDLRRSYTKDLNIKIVKK